MPKTMKQRIYTYGQLDTILHRRGQHFPGVIDATLYGNVIVRAIEGRPHFIIRYDGSRNNYVIANVESVAGGDTLYCVAGAPKMVMDGSAAARKRWRACVSAFTPRVIAGRTPPLKKAEYWRVRDGIARLLPAPAHNYSLLLPQCNRPAMKEWANQTRSLHLPRFTSRSKAFAVNLRKELDGLMGAKMQLLRYGEGIGAFKGRNGLLVHVCLPPTETTNSPSLCVLTTPHDSESRTHFHVDGDYGIRHSQFEGRSGMTYLRWRSAKDAIIGIREWVMSNIYIPGN